MGDASLKLGDNVMICGGAYAGHEGLVVGIIQTNGSNGIESVKVRVATSPKRDIVVAPREIRKG